jgi:hypothetical protein
MRKYLWLILAAGWSVLNGPNARADATFCNSWSQPIWSSYGEWHLNEDYWNGTTNPWALIAGWYYIQPGQCATVLIGDVCFWWAYLFNNCPDNVLYYAEDASGGS